MTGLEKALLDAQEALARPQVAADLQAMLEAGMPLVDRSGQPLRYDLGELLLSLDMPGNVGLCQRLLRDAQRWHDEHPPSDAPRCPAAGTGAEVAAHQAAADLQGGGSPSLSWEAALLRDLAPLIPAAGAVAHLAILREPYMSLVASGAKSIESRWGKVKCAPHDGVLRGEVVVFKRAGGPILGWAEVDWAWRWDLREYSAAGLIRSNPGLAIGEDYATTVAGARWATFVGLKPYYAIEAGHVALGKTDQRGWVRLGALP